MVLGLKNNTLTGGLSQNHDEFMIFDDPEMSEITDELTTINKVKRDRAYANQTLSSEETVRNLCLAVEDIALSDKEHFQSSKNST